MHYKSFMSGKYLKDFQILNIVSFKGGICCNRKRPTKIAERKAVQGETLCKCKGVRAYCGLLISTLHWSGCREKLKSEMDEPVTLSRMSWWDKQRLHGTLVLSSSRLQLSRNYFASCPFVTQRITLLPELKQG